MQKNVIISILITLLFVISLNYNSISIEVDNKENKGIDVLETEFKISADGDGIVGSGDTVNLTYWLSLNAFYDEEGATPIDYNCPGHLKNVTAGVGDFISGFDSALMGMRVNETKRVYISAANNPYTDPLLALQDLYFVIHIDALIIDYDRVQPEVVDIYHSPENVTDSDVIKIYCNAIDAAGIKSIILTYRVSINDEIGEWQDVDMTLTNVSNIYSAEIGIFEKDSIIQYYLTATDNAEEENSVKKSNYGAYYSFNVEASPSANWQLTLSIIGLATIGIIVSRRKK